MDKNVVRKYEVFKGSKCVATGIGPDHKSIAEILKSHSTSIFDSTAVILEEDEVSFAWIMNSEQYRLVACTSSWSRWQIFPNHIGAILVIEE